MQMTLTRSGGLVAAPGLWVRALVTLGAEGGEVRTADGYERTLDRIESAALLEDAEAVILSPPASTARSPSPDAFQLEVAIVADDRRSVTIRCPTDGAVAPPVARLSQWAALEADAIVRRRLERA